MSNNIVEVVANKEGLYPITLYGTEYLIKPVDKLSEPAKKPKAKKAEVGQPSEEPSDGVVEDKQDEPKK